MFKLTGVGAARGVAAGRVYIYEDSLLAFNNAPVGDANAELERFQAAQKKALAMLSRLYEKAVEDVGLENAEIIEIQRMMIEEPDYNGFIQNEIINNRRSAEYAVQLASDKFANTFAAMDNDYMKARAADIVDISNRLIRILQGVSLPDLSNLEEPAVIVARDLLPSQTLQMDKSKILAFVTAEGSTVSHASILARSLNIPAVTGLGDQISELKPGRIVLVDGHAGTVIVDPEPRLITEAANAFEQAQTELRGLKAFRDQPTVTRDGCKVTLAANIARPSDVSMVLENGGEGIGLFRSEFLFMESAVPPDEETQYQAYHSVLKRMGTRPVIVRTLDIGADKTVPYLNLPREENPALGYRAIRLCLDRPEFFKVQLRALLRASVHGNLHIMFPMIVSVRELRAAKQLLAECKQELREKGIPVAGTIPVGIMIETPAAALLSDELAPECDFFSVGTNDLLQYTLAADRMNSKVAQTFADGQKAVLRLIHLAAMSAAKHGIWCGVCGEAAADPELIPALLALGVRELSVSPSSILQVRRQVCSLDLSSIRDEYVKDLAYKW